MPQYNMHTLNILGQCSDGTELDVTYVGLDILTNELLVYVHAASDNDISYRAFDVNNPRYHFVVPTELIENGLSFAFIDLSNCNVTAVKMETIGGSQKELFSVI